jgi:MOSC domain-containing protein YiiM
MNRRGKVVSVNTSSEKGTRKTNVLQSCLLPEFGLKEDAHAGRWHRQVSLLAMESIAKMVHLGLKVGPGDFAENITTQGLDLLQLPVGTRFRIGNRSLLEVTQIGKVCHTRCAIYYQAGDCVMPKEGIFARVLEGGEIKVGDEIHVLSRDSDDQ